MGTLSQASNSTDFQPMVTPSPPLSPNSAIQEAVDAGFIDTGDAPPPDPPPGDSPANPQYVNGSDSDDSEAKTACSDSSRTLGSQDTSSPSHSPSESESSYSPSETCTKSDSSCSSDETTSSAAVSVRLPYSSSPEATSDDDSTGAEIASQKGSFSQAEERCGVWGCQQFVSGDEGFDVCRADGCGTILCQTCYVALRGCCCEECILMLCEQLANLSITEGSQAPGPLRRTRTTRRT